MSGHSKHYAGLQSFRYGTPDQRQWLRAAQEAAAWVEGTGENGQPVEFAHPYAAHQLCERAFRNGPGGTKLIAWSLLELGIADFPRSVISGLLTRIVRQPLDWHPNSAQSFPPDSTVSVFGHMLQRLVSQVCDKVVQWFEDMAAGSPEAVVEEQPTTVIRGLAFSPSIQQEEMIGFWERAVLSPKFPDRIFAGPCHPRDGVIFSPYLLRAFARFLELAPLAAVERFVPVIRDQANRKAIEVRDEERSRILIEEIEASAEEQRFVRKRLIETMAETDRRTLVQTIMYPLPEPNGTPTAEADGS